MDTGQAIVSREVFLIVTVVTTDGHTNIHRVPVASTQQGFKLLDSVLTNLVNALNKSGFPLVLTNPNTMYNPNYIVRIEINLSPDVEEEYTKHTMGFLRGIPY